MRLCIPITVGPFFRSNALKEWAEYMKWDTNGRRRNTRREKCSECSSKCCARLPVKNSNIPLQNLFFLASSVMLLLLLLLSVHELIKRMRLNFVKCKISKKSSTSALWRVDTISTTFLKFNLWCKYYVRYIYEWMHVQKYWYSKYASFAAQNYFLRWGNKCDAKQL